MAATARPAQPASKTTPGVEAAKAISMVTGVAISPLLGVGAVGAYTWWTAQPERRPHLHWYAQPWFWVPALLLVTIIGLKDVLGTAAPTALKKPFDVAETVENKISALIAAGAFIPLIIAVFPEAAGGSPEAMHYSPLAGCFAAISGADIGNALLVPIALAAFVVVWLASHAINVLILLSPFTTLDTALKTARLGLLGILTSAGMANVFLSAAMSVVLIIIAYFIAGWSLRLTVMGSVFVWDCLTFRRRRFQPGTERNRMFLAKAMLEAPVRSYGALRNEKDGLVFEYRPWLILPKRRFKLDEGDYTVGCGLFYSEISLIREDRLAARFVLPPRYSGHEEALSRAYGMKGVQDVGMRKGFKAGWAWLKSVFRPTAQVAPAESVQSVGGA
jgi:hypothetical protein